MDRRSLVETSATLGLGALAGCALPVSSRYTARDSAKTPVNLPATQVPIAGTDMVFPLGRI